MKFHHTHDADKGLFTLQEDTQTAGEIAYSLSGKDTLIIDHTEVDEAFQGQHLGKQLVDKVVAYARQNNLKIIPKCPYARKVFEKAPDTYADVWQKDA